MDIWDRKEGGCEENDFRDRIVVSGDTLSLRHLVHSRVPAQPRGPGDFPDAQSICQPPAGPGPSLGTFHGLRRISPHQ